MKRVHNALIIAFLLLYGLFGAVIIEGARAAFWQWSTSSSSNGNSDPTISWIEGMPPSVVNDSGRAMMARLAEQFADTSGALTTTGGPTAYTVSTAQGFPDPPNDGMVLGVTFNVDSGTGPTIAVDGGAPHPIDSAPATATTVSAGIPYTMIYRSSGAGAWMVRGGGGGGTPLGAIIPYSGTTEPSTGYKFANGQCISTTTYATYWTLVGTPGPGSCAAGNFAVLDLRGRVLAGLDNLGGAAAAGRLTSDAAGCGAAFTSIGAVCPNGNERHLLTVAEMPSHYHYAPIADPGHTHGVTGSATWNQNACTHCGIGGGGDFGAASTVGISGNTTGVYVNGVAANYTAAVGGNGYHPVVQPTAGINYLIRVQ